ncbi:hypothetical protein BAY61_12400 [Prauserella marina]|uniref:Uncharacterized protein n=1 Tax=Prauserella marina TaxID=530584 RepID=A0A222VP16_9PSEU|nr:hypothetical protein [Prauserella marina]ASR35665.1 hypothetical protein BAY61_12400 [Prauserella marina]PWV84460.1 hypothetical protein DES30_101477 [Prauserella marina]SDC21997.1 hypothetical protein SAMN05421630_101860 [Prauserella marina]
MAPFDVFSCSDQVEEKRLRPFRRSQVLHRWLYTIGFADHTWTVDVDLSDEDGAAELYRDGLLHARGELPVAFAVPGGRVEVDAGLYGVTRAHLVRDDGEERRLTPARGTAEDLRGRLARRHPLLSTAIAWLAIAVLAVNLVLAVPQALELLTTIPKIADNVGTFTSPVVLPMWLNISLITAGALAATERVLTLRRNRVLDVETLWTGL